MSLAEHSITRLDAALNLAGGEDVVLRRKLPGKAAVDVTCRARVNRLPSPESGPGPKVALSEVIISPTQINAAGWPGDLVVEPFSIDQRIPRENGPDQVIMRGENPRTIIHCDPKFVAGVLVRIDLRVSG